MKVLVYDVAAESGGVLTILKNVYQVALERKDIEWKFILSVVDLKVADNISVENYPKVKNGWLTRLAFDKFTAPKIIKEFAPDIVINLQNVAVKTKAKQIQYMHQPLPFVEYRFKFSESKVLWIQQNIIGRMIKKSCKKVDEIIVQTKWVKDAIMQQTKVSGDKIAIKSPVLRDDCIVKYKETLPMQYVYPASACLYKNHKVIIEALEILAKEKKYPKVTFTLKGDENELIKGLFGRCEKNSLNVEWKGGMPYEDVMKTYSYSTLLFPSFVETFGLPLLEARMSGAPIIAADTVFAKEILDGYTKAQFFEIHDSVALSKLM